MPCLHGGKLGLDLEARQSVLPGWNRHPSRAIHPSIATEQSAGDNGFTFGATFGLRCRALFPSQRIAHQRVSGGGSRIDQRSLAKFLEHVRRVGVPSARNAAANDKHIEIQNVDQACQQYTEVAAEGAEEA